MNIRRIGLFASFAVAGAIVLTACGGGSHDATSAHTDTKHEQVAKAGDSENLDGTSDGQIPPVDAPDQDAIDVSAPASGYASVIVAANDVEMGATGGVDFVPGDVHNGDNGPEFVATQGDVTQHATMAADAEYASPTGCAEPHSDVRVDANDVGLTPCTAADYFNEADHDMPMIYLNDSGEIVKIADRYHP